MLFFCSTIYKYADGHSVDTCQYSVTDQFKSMISDGHVFTSVTDGKTYHEWGHDAICAQAYIGSFGITEALRRMNTLACCTGAPSSLQKSDA